MYWEGEKPEWISLCEATIRRHTSRVQLLSASDFTDLREEDCDIPIEKLYVAHRADYIRAYLLAKFGGLWVDADCVVLKNLDPLIGILGHWDFLGYRERQGHVGNNFMGAKQDSRIAAQYYKNVVDVLRRRQKFGWLEIGAHALTAAIDQRDSPFLQITTDLIQPICWSEPGRFFRRDPIEQHERRLNMNSFCYMLSAHMVSKHRGQNPSDDLLHPDSFFTFIVRRAMEQ